MKLHGDITEYSKKNNNMLSMYGKFFKKTKKITYIIKILCIEGPTYRLLSHPPVRQSC